MKTIEQAAREFEKTDIQIDSKKGITVVVQSFIAGVEFAEQWISVEEEEPPIGLLNVMNLNCVPPYTYSIYEGEGVWRNPYDKHITSPTPTHYRPINRK